MQVQSSCAKVRASTWPKARTRSSGGRLSSALSCAALSASRARHSSINAPSSLAAAAPADGLEASQARASRRSAVRSRSLPKSLGDGSGRCLFILTAALTRGPLWGTHSLEQAPSWRRNKQQTNSTKDMLCSRLLARRRAPPHRLHVPCRHARHDARRVRRKAARFAGDADPGHAARGIASW